MSDESQGIFTFASGGAVLQASVQGDAKKGTLKLSIGDKECTWELRGNVTKKDIIQNITSLLGPQLGNEKAAEQAGKLIAGLRQEITASRTASWLLTSFSEEGVRVQREQPKPLPQPVLQVQHVEDPVKVAKYVKELREAFPPSKYPVSTLATAVDRLLLEGHVKFVDAMEGKERSKWRERTISDLLHMPGNESLRAALLQLQEEWKTAPKSSSRFAPLMREEGKVALVEEELRTRVLPHIQRNPHMSGEELQQFTNIGEPPELSAFGVTTIDLNKIVEKNRSEPSCADRPPYEKRIKNSNTNLGNVISFHGDRPHVVVSRSGRTTNLPRLRASVIDAMRARLEAGGLSERGFKKMADGSYEFCHQITSHMDLSQLKSLVAPGGSEVKYLMEVLATIDEWPEKGCKIKVVVEGKEETILLRKPRISQHLLSQTVQGLGVEVTRGMRLQVADLGQSVSDRMNFVSNQQYLMDVVEKMGINLGEEWDKAAVALREELGKHRLKPSTEFSRKDALGNKWVNFDEIPLAKLIWCKSFFESTAYANYQKMVARVILSRLNETSNEEERNALKSLYALTFRKTPPPDVEPILTSVNNNTFTFTPRLEEEVHAADLELYQNNLNDFLSLSSGKQCKSGKDRTSLSVALAVAQDRFQRQFHKMFMPDEMKQKELLYFKKFFREALNEFGVYMTVESLGRSGIKWGGAGGNAVGYKYLYLEEDLGLLKTESIEADPVADVKGLTSNEIMAHGKKQYSGKLVDPTHVYGKSELHTIEEVHRFQTRALSSKTAKEAKGAVETLLESLRPPGVKELLNDQLEPRVHIKELHLEDARKYALLEEAIATLKTTIQEAKKSALPLLRMQLYALEHIKELADERANALKTLEFAAKNLHLRKRTS